jgi:hypothetical protein
LLVVKRRRCRGVSKNSIHPNGIQSVCSLLIPYTVSILRVPVLDPCRWLAGFPLVRQRLASRFSTRQITIGWCTATLRPESFKQRTMGMSSLPLSVRGNPKSPLQDYGDNVIFARALGFGVVITRKLVVREVRSGEDRVRCMWQAVS